MVEPQLERNQSSSSAMQDDDWFADYEMEDNILYSVDLEKVNSHLRGPKLMRGFSFTMVEQTEIETKQMKLIEETKEILRVSDTLARAALLKYSWDKAKLF